MRTLYAPTTRVGTPTRRVGTPILTVGFLFLLCLSACESTGFERLDPEPCDGDGTVPLTDEQLARLARRPVGPPPEDKAPPAAACRAALPGEVLVNEVLSRPAGRDLDGDGKSTANDEAIELVSVAAEPVHVHGMRLVYRGEQRGKVTTERCLLPFGAAVLVGSKAADFELPPGATLYRLDRTLRLTDSGGALALVGAGGEAIDKVAVPLAKTVTQGCVTRALDADRQAALLPHAHVPEAEGRTWSPGTCADGQRFPMCVAARIVARTFHRTIGQAAANEAGKNGNRPAEDDSTGR